LALSHPQSGLLLYCVTADAQDSHDALRSAIVVALGKTLPRHMLPNAVVLLAAFPLSSAGKIDRDALLARAVTTETAYVAPATDAERVLAQIWCRVLGVTRAGRHDDFFALGGDSIKALEVLNGIRATGYTCELKDFFAFPLLTDMASALAPWRESGLFRAPLAGHMSLLPVQRWFLRSRSGDAARHFNIVAELNVSADVSASVLADAMAVLIQHHDSLRCRFYPQNGQWLQEVQQTLSVDDVLSHYRRTTTAGMQADQCAIEELACRPFDLATGPLVRGILVQAPDGVSETLVLALHHLVADWVSLRTLIADLNALTQALLDADIDVARLSPPHLLQAVTDARCAELQSVPLTDADAYRKAVATTASLAPACGVHNELHTLHVQIAADDLTALREFLRRESAVQQSDFRLQDFLLATTLSELGGLLPVDEIPLLVESHGRDGELDLSRQVAWLTRARLVNIDPQVFTGADGLLQAYRVLQSDAIGRPDVFACMAADAEPQTALPALVSFNYLGEFTNSQSQDNLFTLTGRVFDKAMAPTSPVDVPLHMEFYVVDQALEIQVAWSPAVFKSDIMRTCWERVRRRFARL
ncbi:MAG: condensation domain-containing protein, partial [Pseudohongiella sp.]